jgi:AmiR/NasT family two-component response regulator
VTGPTKTSEPLRVVVAADDALLRQGIASLLREVGHRVVGRAGDAGDLMLKVRSYLPDVAIVDVRMPPRFSEAVVGPAWLLCGLSSGVPSRRPR